jgi:hypothetical protein
MRNVKHLQFIERTYVLELLSQRRVAHINTSSEEPAPMRPGK